MGLAYSRGAGPGTAGAGHGGGTEAVELCLGGKSPIITGLQPPMGVSHKVVTI